MFFKKRQAAPVVKTAKVIALVDVLMDQKVLKYEDSVFYIYKELIIGKERKNIVKNLFFYARTKNLVKADGTIYIKDLDKERGNPLLAVHNNKEGTIFLDTPKAK